MKVYYKLRCKICDRAYVKEEIKFLGHMPCDRIWETRRDLFEYFGLGTLHHMFWLNELYEIYKFDDKMNLVKTQGILDFVCKNYKKFSFH